LAQGDGGVVLLDVPADSAAARAGLRKDDLIQGINTSKVSNVRELTTAYSAVGQGPIEVRFVRGQKPQTLKLPAEH
jgi:S1-C subfamily serine protease